MDKVKEFETELKFLIRSFNPPLQQAEQAMSMVDFFTTVVNKQRQLIEQKDKEIKELTKEE